MANIQSVVDYLNGMYTYKTLYEDATVCIPAIEEWDDTIIAFWECGAIVSIDKDMYFIEENNMHWELSKEGSHYPIACLKSLRAALFRLRWYIKKNYPREYIE